MAAAHLHVMLNHFSVIGSIFAFALLVIATVRHSRELIMVSFAFAVAIALVSIAVYFTGEPAEAQISKLQGVSLDTIHAHEEAAQFGFAAIECVGALGLAGLLLFRTEPVPRWFLMIMLVGSFLTMGAMYYTADKGRRIRHPEFGEAGHYSRQSSVLSRQFSAFKNATDDCGLKTGD